MPTDPNAEYTLKAEGVNPFFIWSDAPNSSIPKITRLGKGDVIHLRHRDILHISAEDTFAFFSLSLLPRDFSLPLPLSHSLPQSHSFSSHTHTHAHTPSPTSSSNTSANTMNSPRSSSPMSDHVTDQLVDRSLHSKDDPNSRQMIHAMTFADSGATIRRRNTIVGGSRALF